MPRGIPSTPGYRREDMPKTYDSWRAARRRTIDQSHKDFPKYGGRGITFHADWFDSFEQFVKDVGVRPEGMTLDRIDVNGHYEPGNVRWADAKTQRANQRRRTTA